MIEPRKTPCAQSKASWTSGTTAARLPPNKMAEMGTPSGSSHSSAIAGSWLVGALKRQFGCAAGVGESGVHSSPRQSVQCAGGSSVRPSHQMSPSSVSAGFVEVQLAASERTALQYDA